MSAHGRRLVRVALAATAWAGTAAGCGTAGDQGSAGQAPGTAASPHGTGGAHDATTVGVFGNDTDATAEAGTGTGSCASSFVQASALPLMLVFMFDRSGSMADLESTDGGPKESKWSACVTGLEAFLGDPSSVGLYASLQFFMQPDECDVDAYATPQVPMTALPNGTLFNQAFADTLPDGETPTVPALQGALAFAAETRAKNPGAKVAAVFVTDGEPNGCDSTIANAAKAAAAAAGSADAGGGAPTYVIGIGKVKSLDAIAEAGATGQAFIVSTGDPRQTAVDFRAALGTIRGSFLGCSYPIPRAPAGQTLDFGAVNVVFTPSGGVPDTVPYDKDCGAGGGWHYDDPGNPTTIEICPARCATVEGDPAGSIALELGCATVGNLR